MCMFVSGVYFIFTKNKYAKIRYYIGISMLECYHVMTLKSIYMSQFAMVEVMATSLMDGFGGPLMKFLRHKEMLVLAVCSTAFLLGIPHVMQVPWSVCLDHIGVHSSDNSSTAIIQDK